MKKTIFTLLILSAVFSSAFADRIISPDSLSKGAIQFIQKNFPHQQIQYVEEDFSEYEIILEDGTEINIDKRGNWETIKSYQGVNPALLPKNIASYLATSYPNTIITEVEKDRFNFEVKLSNHMELYFDSKGRFLGQKYDD